MSPDIYLSDNYLVLDFETDTSHGDYGHPVHKDNGLLLASWKWADSDVVSHWGGEFDQEKLLRDVEAADFLVAHNAKYELGWLRRCGLNLDNVIVFDTKIAEYVLFGNLSAGCESTGLPKLSTSLDMCCRRRGWKIKDPVVDIMMGQSINPKYMPRPWLQGRCEQDVETTERLFLTQLDSLRETRRLPILYTRCILTPVLADMEFQGMHLDRDRVLETYEDYRKRLIRLQREFDEIAEGINWKSPMQVAEFLYSPEPEGLGFDELRRRDGTPKRTKSGRKAADKATIQALVPRTDRQKSFLALRTEIGKVQAALSKSLEFFKGVVDEYDDQVFYAVFNQTVTATHRLSSSGHKTKFEQFDKPKTVQFQNMARIFKPLFNAREDGWLMMEADGSQLEFRVAADLGHDKQALADITDPDFDAHCLTAGIINKIPYEEFLEGYRSGDKKFKNMRTAAKVHTFKPLYGGESGTKSEKAYYTYFKDRYRGIAETQEAWVEDVLINKRLITAWGMRYYWPRAKRSMSDGYVNVKSAVYNYPVQALATAEIIPVAVVNMKRRLSGMDGVRMVNTVHDSIILEVREDMIDTVRQEAIYSFGQDVYDYMERVYNYEFKVPLGCGVTVGTHWSEGAEESYNIWPHGELEKVA